jgi:hypothetical protein
MVTLSLTLISFRKLFEKSSDILCKSLCPGAVQLNLILFAPSPHAQQLGLPRIHKSSTDQELNKLQWFLLLLHWLALIPYPLLPTLGEGELEVVKQSLTRLAQYWKRAIQRVSN